MMQFLTREPVRAWALAACVVWLVAALIDHKPALEAIGPFLPILGVGESVRGAVAPVAGLTQDASVIPADEVSKR